MMIHMKVWQLCLSICDHHQASFLGKRHAGICLVCHDFIAQNQDGVSYASVIMYHRFGEDRYPSTNTTIEQLEAHIAYLQDGNYNIMPLQEIIIFQSGQTVPDKTVAITIDDAYLSVYKQDGLISKTPIFQSHYSSQQGLLTADCAAI